MGLYCDSFKDVKPIPDNSPLKIHRHYDLLSLWGKIKFWVGILKLMLSGWYDDGSGKKRWISRKCKIR
jgi:hypothetical protein